MWVRSSGGELPTLIKSITRNSAAALAQVLRLHYEDARKGVREATCRGLATAIRLHHPINQSGTRISVHFQKYCQKNIEDISKTHRMEFLQSPHTHTHSHFVGLCPFPLFPLSSENREIKIRPYMLYSPFPAAPLPFLVRQISVS